MLGFVGPALLLLIMSLLSWRGYGRAVTWSEGHLTDRVEKSNRFAAKFVAEVVSRELDQYLRAVEAVAGEEQLRQHMRSVIDDDQLNSILKEIARLEVPIVKSTEIEPSAVGKDDRVADATDGGDGNRSRLDALLASFVNHPARQPLQQFVDGLMANEKTPKAASWFVTSDSGTFLAAAFDSQPERSTLGWNYSWRTYFHGGPNDLSRWQRPSSHIDRTHLSAVFQSTATHTWKVAISTPVSDGDAHLGLVALTIELGNFVEFPGTETQFAVLVNARDGQNKGVILEHPLYDQILATSNALPSHFSQYRVDVSQWERTDVLRLYRDPLGGDDKQGAAYQRDWIAAKAPVQLARTDAEGNRHVEDSGWMVLVQEDKQAAATPVYLLGEKLVRDGLVALAVILAVVIALWYFVVRVLGEPGSSHRYHPVKPSPPASLHSQETIELLKAARQK
jgi:hypothetical protein